MEDFGMVITSAWNALGMEINIYGFSFSFRAVLIFVMLASMALGFIAYLLNQ